MIELVQLSVELKASLIKNFHVTGFYCSNTFLPIYWMMGYWTINAFLSVICTLNSISFSILASNLFEFVMKALHSSCELFDDLLFSPLLNWPADVFDESHFEKSFNRLKNIMKNIIFLIVMINGRFLRNYFVVLGATVFFGKRYGIRNHFIVTYVHQNFPLILFYNNY